jgi:hypothetical protein
MKMSMNINNERTKALTSLLELEFSCDFVMPSSSLELAKEIRSEKFKTQLTEMMDLQDKIKPAGNALDDGSRLYSLTQRRTILAKCFPMGKFDMRTQVLTGKAHLTPMTYGTLYMTTDNGVLPWFSRMGGGSSMDKDSDSNTFGRSAGSAESRLMIGLGLMRGDDLEVVIEQAEEHIVNIETYLNNTGENISQVIANYESMRQSNNDGTSYLKVLSEETIRLSRTNGRGDKKASDEFPSIAEINRRDIAQIYSFLRMEV